MVINVHAGHAAMGMGSVGAVGILNESVEDRKVKDVVIEKLRALGHTVYDCTVDSGDKEAILVGVVKKCNEHNVDLDVSIHLNSGAGRNYNDGVTTGTEVYVFSDKSKAKDAAERVLERISALGFANRGIKVNPKLYVLEHTKAPAMLVECCFVDDKDDTDRFNPEEMGRAIAEGIANATAPIINPEPVSTPAPEPQSGQSNVFQVRIICDALRVRKEPNTDAEIMKLVHKNESFHIVEEVNGWGRLQSGAGWICLGGSLVERL